MSAPIPRARRGWRLFIFYSWSLLLTGLVSMLFADLLWRTGWSASRTVLLVLFVVLMWFASVGCVHGVYGFFLRIFGARRRITALGNFRDRKIDGTSTAVVFPIYNENVVRACEVARHLRIAGAHRATGALRLFHLEPFHRPGQMGRGGAALAGIGSAIWTRSAKSITADG